MLDLYFWPTEMAKDCHLLEEPGLLHHQAVNIGRGDQLTPDF
jgi:hypothetical protein